MPIKSIKRILVIKNIILFKEILSILNKIEIKASTKEKIIALTMS